MRRVVTRPMLVLVPLLLMILTACGGPAELPDVEGEDLQFTRGAMESAEIEYDVEEVEVDDPEEDGIVQRAYRDEDGNVIVEVGTTPTITITGEFQLTDEMKFKSISGDLAGDRCTRARGATAQARRPRGHGRRRAARPCRRGEGRCCRDPRP